MFWNVIVTALVVIVVLALVAGYLLHWFYQRASQEVAFVRTGLGGRQVVQTGGTLVVPLVHAITPVNMNTLRLEVSRGRDQAVITKNRMRVDVTAEFYVHVAPNEDAISMAAQTLGTRTMEPTALVELISGKFVDALRRVAAELTMEQLHEERGAYAQRVRDVVSDDLLRNGLELETVSITQLDQTDMEFFDPSNAFDAEGLTNLTEEIEQRKKTRNDIEQDTMVQIRSKNLETEKVTLDIDRESEYARLGQQRELELARATQRAEIAREQADKNREAQQAEIAAREALERSRLDEERVTEEARLGAERATEEARIAREREVERLEIERRKLLEIAEQERTIAVAEKSKEQSEKRAQADLARAKAITAEERIQSAREVEIAQRRKLIAITAAEEEATREGVRLKLVAEAEKEAATDRADATRILAESDADAEKIRVAAAKIRHQVEAEAARLMNEAQNILTPESRMSSLRMRLIEKMEGIIRESVKPLENIEGIRILHVDGLGSGMPSKEGGSAVTDDVVNSALRYRAQAPLVDHLLREIGIEGGDVQKWADNLIQPRRQDVAKLAEKREELTHSEDHASTGEDG